MEDEELLWSGRPSQISNIPVFTWCILFSWLWVPLLIAIYRWLKTRTTRYTLTSQRFTVTYGILNKKIDELELYRVKDTRLDKPFWLRIFNLGHVIIIATDKTTPRVQLSAVQKPEKIRESIRKHVEIQREKKKVREIDI